MKRFVVFTVCLFLFISPYRVLGEETAKIYPYDPVMADYWFVPAAAEFVPQNEAKALLLMEWSTGRVLFRQNELEHLPIASVTKVMSTLLVTEAIDDGRIRLDDVVTVSENAASMGGSQIFLEPGEQMTVRDLLKSLIVVSANDATVALGEHLCGSEASFVAEMNKRAAELGCADTNFINTNGLPAEGHYSCALDVAVITRELMKHPLVFEYSGIWMDTIRNGSFGLANTNKLIRFYNGATGMKTGFTSEAGFCLSGTAEREGMKLIAVVLGCETSDKRFASAKSMLDFGFANYRVFSPEAPSPEPIKVRGGESGFAGLKVSDCAILDEKNARGGIEAKITLPDSVEAPVSAGDVVGQVIYSRAGAELARADVTVCEDVPEMGYGAMLKKLLSAVFRL